MDLLPYVNLRDYKNNPIQDSISSFKYTFSEEGDDVCEIVIKDADPLLSDKPEFQEGKKLYVDWGYVGGRKSRTRTIFIFDTETDYDDVVTLKLTCHEKFALAKMDVASNQNLSTAKKGMPLIFSSSVISNINLELEKGNSSLENILKESNIQVKDKSIVTKEVDNQINVVSLYNGNKSTYAGLRTFLNTLPGGPYIIDSRDENVTIKKRDLLQKAFKSWVYRGGNGELIKFKPEKKTRSKASGSSKIKVNSWDPETQESTTQTSSSTDFGLVKLNNSNLFPTLENLDIMSKGAQFAPIYGKVQSSTKDRPKLLDKGHFGPGGPQTKKVYKSADYGDRPGYGGTSARSTTAVFKVKETLESTDEPQEVILSPEHNEVKAKALADNTRQDNEDKNEKGSAEVIGDPTIENGIIVNFQGVSVKDSGNYYLFECEHSITDSGGYILSLSQIGRQGKNVKSNKTKNYDGSAEQDYFNNSDSKINPGIFKKRDGFYIEDGIAVNDTKAQQSPIPKILIPVKKP